MKTKLRFMVLTGCIAAAYAALSIVSALAGLAYGQVQFRLSESLCVLAAFTPAAIPGLTLGCFLANLGSTLGPVDMLCGTAATLVAAIIGYAFRRFKAGGVAWPAMLACIVVNALIVGAELALLTSSGESFFAAFAINAAMVAVGQTAVCLLAGVPLSMAIDRTPKIKQLLK